MGMYGTCTNLYSADWLVLPCVCTLDKLLYLPDQMVVIFFLWHARIPKIVHAPLGLKIWSFDTIFGGDVTADSCLALKYCQIVATDVTCAQMYPLTDELIVTLFMVGSVPLKAKPTPLLYIYEIQNWFRGIIIGNTVQYVY